MGFSRVLKAVLAEIKPTSKDEQYEKDLAAGLIKRIARTVPKGAKVVLAGSIAKGTFLRGSKDTDIFILMPKKIAKEQFEGLLKKIINAAFPSARYELKYAEHPYARVFLDSGRLDIVPAYEIKNAEELKSAVDRSILHTVFIIKNLRKKQKDEVRLLKKMLKANELYGAEIKVEGFSGYLCELCIIYYGNFVKTMKNIAKWKTPAFIDIKRYYRAKQGQENAIKRFNTPLVVIDPVDKNRNVAAAVSAENVKKLIALAKRFLKRAAVNLFLDEPPSFWKKTAALGKRRRKNAALYVISAQKPEIVDDILWGQLKKLGALLETYLCKNGFIVQELVFGDEKGSVHIALLVKTETLPERKIMKGPVLKLEKNAMEFRKAHKGERVFVKRGKLFVEVKRELRNAGDALHRFFNKAKLPSHFENAKAKIKTIQRITGQP